MYNCTKITILSVNKQNGAQSNSEENQIVSKIPKEWLKKRKRIHILVWPSQSVYLNPVEMLRLNQKIAVLTLFNIFLRYKMEGHWWKYNPKSSFCWWSMSMGKSWKQFKFLESIIGGDGFKTKVLASAEQTVTKLERLKPIWIDKI